MGKSPQFPSPKAFALSLFRPLTQFEAQVRKPLADAGMPAIPGLAEMTIKVLETLPELPAMPAMVPFLGVPGVTPPGVVTEKPAPMAPTVRYG